MYSSRKINIEPTEVAEPNREDPYQALWCGVINQAYMDVRLGPIKVYADCDSREEYTERSYLEAKKFESYWKDWLSSDDFIVVCGYAEVEHELIRDKLHDEFVASHARYLNGISMRYTKILRKKTAEQKAQALQWQKIMEKHT